MGKTLRDFLNELLEGEDFEYGMIVGVETEDGECISSLDAMELLDSESDCLDYTYVSHSKSDDDYMTIVVKEA